MHVECLALHTKDTVEIGCPLLGPTRSLVDSPTGIRGIRAGIGQSNKLPVPSLIHILEVLLPPDYLTGLCQTGVCTDAFPIPPTFVQCPHYSPVVLSTNTHRGRRRRSQTERDTLSTVHTANTTTHRTPAKVANHPFSLRPPASRPLVSVAALHCTPLDARLSLTHETCFLTPHSALSAPSQLCDHPFTTRTTAAVSSHTEATHWRCTGAGRNLSTLVGPTLKPPDAETLQNAIATSKARADTRRCDNTPFVDTRRNIELAILLHIT